LRCTCNRIIWSPKWFVEMADKGRSQRIPTFCLTMLLKSFPWKTNNLEGTSQKRNSKNYVDVITHHVTKL
jgi:hypothetical protein